MISYSIKLNLKVFLDKNIYIHNLNNLTKHHT